jgi:hypothetical protein
VPGTDTAVPAAVESELVALGAATDGTAVILGGTGVVSLAIETDLGTIFARLRATVSDAGPDSRRAVARRAG